MGRIPPNPVPQGEAASGFALFTIWRSAPLEAIKQQTSSVVPPGLGFSFVWTAYPVMNSGATLKSPSGTLMSKEF